MELLRPGRLGIACVLLATAALPAQAVTVNDTPAGGPYYMGADDNGYGDRIGSADYEIFSADLSRTGNTLTVSIHTNFAGLGDDGLFADATNTPAGMSNGIGYGDLFLAETWAPVGPNPHQTDQASNGTVWSYGFALDNRWMAEGGADGTGTLYSLNSGDNTTDTLLSNAFMSNPLENYRNGQEVAVNTSSNVTPGNSGTWSLDADNKRVEFVIDLTGTDLENSDSIAFHWAMTCANDTIEGDAILPSEIPVPGALWLMGSGLLGLLSVSRRRKHA